MAKTVFHIDAFKDVNFFPWLVNTEQLIWHMLILELGFFTISLRKMALMMCAGNLLLLSFYKPEMILLVTSDKEGDVSQRD